MDAVFLLIAIAFFAGCAFFVTRIVDHL